MFTAFICVHLRPEIKHGQREDRTGDRRGQAHRPRDRVAAVSQGLPRSDPLRTSEQEARATAEECGSAPLFQADLEKVDDIRRMFREVEERLGSLYGLVNNAARFRRSDPLEITEADWDFIHSVNLKATFFCCQQGALLMKKAGAGSIVNISSLGGIRPWAEVRALLRVESRRDHADARAG